LLAIRKPLGIDKFAAIVGVQSQDRKREQLSCPAERLDDRSLITVQ